MPLPRPLAITALLCSCVLAQLSPLLAQTPPTYQQPRNAAAAPLGLTDVQVLDQLMVYVPGIGTPAREDLLRQNIKSYMMPIRQATDARMEWAYALSGCLEYYVNLNNNYKDNLSPDYITLNLAAQGQAPSLVDGLNQLVRLGTVSAAVVPYGSPTIPPAVYSVPKQRVSNYGYLFRQDTRARNKVFEVRKALSRGNPVLVELATDASFTGIKTSTYTPTQAPTETHYLTVIGYDGEAETFELRSSFGRLWANAGYINLSYADFGRLAQTGVVLIPNR